MAAIESRLARLENRRAVADAEPWRMIELRPVADDMWRDDAGIVATIEQHEAAHSGPVIFVKLAD